MNVNKNYQIFCCFLARLVLCCATVTALASVWCQVWLNFSAVFSAAQTVHPFPALRRSVPTASWVTPLQIVQKSSDRIQCHARLLSGPSLSASSLNITCASVAVEAQGVPQSQRTGLSVFSPSVRCVCTRCEWRHLGGGASGGISVGYNIYTTTSFQSMRRRRSE